MSCPWCVLRDALARVTRATEALQDSDLAFVEQTLEDLAADLWREVEKADREEAA